MVYGFDSKIHNQRLKPRLLIHRSFMCEQSMLKERPEQQLTPVSHPVNLNFLD
uniref:Uncharacterized protein n=1 Tax=Anguilla anguilla TaxID=7936 RepID=A0A0E9QSM3_ANGAN